MKATLLFFACVLTLPNVQKMGNQRVIQFNINKILNARPVSTFANNKIISWTKGIDGGGTGDGYLTQSAALFVGDKEPHALPDDALFPANESHPRIQLHYSNNDAKNQQACSLSGEADATFAVPHNKYKAIFLALTSAEGSTALKVALTYTDGTEVEDYIIPDYYQDVAASDSNICYLAHDLAKWGNKNNMTEKDHHNIDLLKIKPDSQRTLKSMKVNKTKPGYLIFWAATGIVTR